MQQPTPAPVEPAVDPAELDAFAAGVHTARKATTAAPPWAAFDPNATPRYNVAIRVNDYQLAMLRYLAEVKDTSQNKLLRRHLMPILKQLALDHFAAEHNSSD